MWFKCQGEWTKTQYLNFWQTYRNFTICLPKIQISERIAEEISLEFEIISSNCQLINHQTS